jgi:hypothetical protein
MSLTPDGAVDVGAVPVLTRNLAANLLRWDGLGLLAAAQLLDFDYLGVRHS